MGQLAQTTLGLNAALGIGLVGSTVIGGALFAVKLITDYFEKEAVAVKKAADEQEKLNKKLADFSGIQAKNAAARANKTGWDAMMEGTSTQADFEDKMELLANAKKTMTTMPEILAQEKKMDDYAAARQQRLNRDWQTKHDQLTISAIEGEMPDDKSGGGGDRETTGAPDWYIDWKLAEADMLKREDDAIIAQEKDKNDQLKDLVDELASYKEDTSYQLSEREKQYGERVLADIEAREQEKKALYRQTGQVAISAFTHAAGASLQAVVKGKKLEAAAIVESIGDALFADGLANEAKALAMMWLPGFQAAAGGLAAAGASEMAIGLAMGGIGARAGSSGPIPSIAGTEPARQADQYGTSGQSSQPIVINMYSMVPSAENGIVIAQALSEARKRRGDSAVAY
jgi:hypothetical protein